MTEICVLPVLLFIIAILFYAAYDTARSLYYKIKKDNWALPKAWVAGVVKKLKEPGDDHNQD